MVEVTERSAPPESVVVITKKPVPPESVVVITEKSISPESVVVITEKPISPESVVVITKKPISPESVVVITKKPISPEIIVNRVKTDKSGCVVTYIGLIRENSQGKRVISVEYSDSEGKAENRLQEIVSATRQKWQLNNMAICHRIGKLNVGDINLVIAVASAHRQEGFLACQYAIDQFKKRMPTQKTETYQDGNTWV